MNGINAFEGDDPYNADGYRRAAQNRVHNPLCHFARRSPSQQRSCGSRSPGSQSAIRKPLRKPTLYNFAPLNENMSGPGYTSTELSIDERQLPHYVVPVLYIPQRIITNEELYSSEIYDEDLVSDEVYQDESSSTQQQLPSEDHAYHRNFQERPRSSLHQESPNRRFSPRSKLTDSETDIYDKLMAKMYWMEQSEEEIAVDNNFEVDYSTSTHDYQQPVSQVYVSENIPRRVSTIEEEKSEFLNPPPSLCSENSSTSLTSNYTRRRAPTRKASSFTQEYVTRNPNNPPPSSPLASASAYTVYPIKQNDYDPHRPVKDQRIEDFKSHLKSRESLCLRNKTRRDSAANLPRQLVAPIQEQPMFKCSLILEEESSESKCTQTAEDTTTATQTGDYKIAKKSYGYMQKAERGPARKKGKTVDCSDSDMTVIIDRGSSENIYTMLGSGPQYTKLPEPKFDKATECFPTVDLLPVQSSTLEPVEKNRRNSKLRTHNRVPSPSRNLMQGTLMK